ncbi:ribose-phosphate pyrophosphokinase [Candidatus Parcubacteria bacterium]|nr:MAG: ribose-phosphate pyrophosphokinase [Candidatus Parcubacteria bacterium]
MMFFGDRSNKELSEKVAQKLGMEVFYPDVHIFADGEIRIRILEDVCEKDILILKSLSIPVNDNIIEFCLTLNVLIESGCRDIFGIVPYLAYSRADHIFRSGEGVPLEVVIRMVEVNGLDKIMLVDPHSIKTPEIFSIPHLRISAIPVFAEKIRELVSNLKDVLLISPDRGGIRRIKILAEELGGVSYAVIDKDRDLETGKLKIVGIEGEVKDTCFIVDDMIAGGATMAEAIEYLDKKGVKNIYGMATHPIFAGNAVKLMQESKAQKIFVTDTISVSKEKQFEKLEILSVADLIAKAVRP